MNELALYFVALSKLSQDDIATAKQIEDKLIELVNEEIVACLAIVGDKVGEWNDVAIRANKLGLDISDEIKKRMKS